VLADALARWQAAAGPYWLYVGAAPFVLPEVKEMGLDPDPDRAVVRVVARFLEGRRGVVFVDLPPERTLPLTSALADHRIVPALQRPGADRRLRRLLETLAPVAPVADPRGAVFLLDGDRARYRYEYPECRFPPPRLLHAEGVEAVGWVAPAGVVAPDLRPYARTLAGSGLDPILL
jgi:hypothetical protein